MRPFFILACLLLVAFIVMGANFPYIRLGGTTNQVTDNGTNLTRNGAAIVSNPVTFQSVTNALALDGDTNKFLNGSGFESVPIGIGQPASATLSNLSNGIGIGLTNLLAAAVQAAQTNVVTTNFVQKTGDTMSGSLNLSGGGTNAAPVVLSSAPLTTTPIPGSLEFLDHTVYFTTYLVRRSIQLNQAIVTTSVTVSNTVAETTIYTIPMAANYITAGKVIVPKLCGIYWASNPQTFTLRLKHNGATLLSTTSTSSGATARPWECIFTTTILTAGTNGTLTANSRMIQDSTINMDALTNSVAFDTTVTNTFDITVQWSSTGANSLRLNQGYTECIQ